ncbi:hypothetical protein CHARACLAT_032351, partial [Characodon lateralis]|nr:hypothetical protein [Characodon lateralis]
MGGRCILVIAVVVWLSEGSCFPIEELNEGADKLQKIQSSLDDVHLKTHVFLQSRGSMLKQSAKK